MTTMEELDRQADEEACKDAEVKIAALEDLLKENGIKHHSYKNFANDGEFLITFDDVLSCLLQIYTVPTPYGSSHFTCRLTFHADTPEDVLRRLVVSDGKLVGITELFDEEK